MKQNAVVINMRKAVLCSCIIVLSVALATTGAEQKPVTNDDVVTMIKAGLPESTIILAIKKGPSAFDTSATALITLKQQGASAGILDAMLQPEVPLTPVKTSTGNELLDAYNEEMSDGRGDGVVLVVGTNRVQLKYAALQVKPSVNYIPFAPDKGYSKLNGERSSARIESDQAHLEFSMSSSVQPSSSVALILFAVRGEERFIQTMSIGFGGVGSSMGFPKERTIAMDIVEAKTLDKKPSSAQIRYVARPKKPLVPGEYALVMNECMAYDFGVDSPETKEHDNANAR